MLNRIYDDALRPLGINTTQKSLLTTIGRFPGGIEAVRLSELQAMERSTLSRNLTTLESAGYLETATDGRDRRRRIVSLTDAGRSLVVRSESYWADAQQRVMDALGPERAHELAAVLASAERTVRELER